MKDSKSVGEVLNTEYITLLLDFVLLRDFNDLVLAGLDFRDDRRTLNILTIACQPESVGDKVCIFYIDCPICSKYCAGCEYY